MSSYLTDGQKALIETALYLRGDALRRRLASREDSGSEAEIRLVDAESRELYQIEAALCHLADDDFGSCAHCGSPIPFDDLRSMPHGMYCVSCETARRQKAGRKRIAASHA